MRTALALSMCFAAIVGCRAETEVVVFHAASLSRCLGEAADAFAASRPGVRVRLEPSGSQTAARKVAELAQRADVVAVADPAVIRQILIPDHARWVVVFAANEVVLAHRAHSRFTEAVTTENWPAVLLRPGVRLGCAAVDLAPIGYRTQLVWQLAAAHTRRPDLPERLQAQCSPAHVMPDETELVALLAARAIDYAFLYRSTAEEQRLKLTRLAPELSLGDPEHAAGYATASVAVRMRSGTARTVIHGSPSTYGLTIPVTAPRPDLALELVAFLLGEGGRRALLRSGFRPLSPAVAAPLALVPLRLAPLVTGGSL